jgi:MSHA pilin protein MshD
MHKPVMYTNNTSNLRTDQTGFTLIELIIFIVVVSVALAGVLTVLNITVRSSADPIQPKQAMLIAEAMLEEILLKPYNNPIDGYGASCPTTCDRAQFDNVSDYANYASTGTYSLDDLTTPISGLENYDVAVSVGAATVTATGNSLAGLVITVNVTVNDSDIYTLSGYRFNYD